MARARASVARSNARSPPNAVCPPGMSATSISSTSAASNGAGLSAPPRTYETTGAGARRHLRAVTLQVTHLRTAHTALQYTPTRHNGRESPLSIQASERPIASGRLQHYPAPARAPLPAQTPSAASGEPRGDPGPGGPPSEKMGEWRTGRATALLASGAGGGSAADATSKRVRTAEERPSSAAVTSANVASCSAAAKDERSAATSAQTHVHTHP